MCNPANIIFLFSVLVFSDQVISQSIGGTAAKDFYESGKSGQIWANLGKSRQSFGYRHHTSEVSETTWWKRKMDNRGRKFVNTTEYQLQLRIVVFQLAFYHRGMIGNQKKEREIYESNENGKTQSYCNIQKNWGSTREAEEYTFNCLF